eukprot:scaffold783_cov118-Cylindrotheca_fusiformis.AAC.3
MTADEEEGKEDTDMSKRSPTETDEQSDGEAGGPFNPPGKIAILLPEVTDEIVALHQAEKEELARTRNGDGEHKECCGIPCYLAITLLVLGVAVVTGTVLLVVLYDPDDDTDPPTQSPTSARIASDAAEYYLRKFEARASIRYRNL